MNYWCEDIHHTCFRESWKHHCNLSLLYLYHINVILTICGCWLLQSLEKRKKSNKFNRLQIEVFPPEYKTSHIQAPPPEYGPIKFVLCPYICPGRINGLLRYSTTIFYDTMKVIFNTIRSFCWIWFFMDGWSLGFMILSTTLEFSGFYEVWLFLCSRKLNCFVPYYHKSSILNRIWERKMINKWIWKS